MNEGMRAAARELVADHQQAFSSGVEGELLRKLLPPDMYEALMVEIAELLTDLEPAHGQD